MRVIHCEGPLSEVCGLEASFFDEESSPKAARKSFSGRRLMVYIAMAYIAMAYVLTAHVVMAYIVMAYIVVAYVVRACRSLSPSV